MEQVHIVWMVKWWHIRPERHFYGGPDFTFIWKRIRRTMKCWESSTNFCSFCCTVCPEELEEATEKEVKSTENCVVGCVSAVVVCKSDRAIWKCPNSWLCLQLGTFHSLRESLHTEQWESETLFQPDSWTQAIKPVRRNTFI